MYLDTFHTVGFTYSIENECLKDFSKEDFSGLNFFILAKTQMSFLIDWKS